MDVETDRAFVDTNVLVYLLGRDREKGARAEAVLREPVTINVQVLNELVNVARRKTTRSWDEIDGFVDALCRLDTVRVRALTKAVHDRGRGLARRHGLSVYDAMIVSAALEAGCSTLLTEDMHAGLVVDGSLTLTNPFA